MISTSPRPRARDARWRAVTARDPRADGLFVYAVSTTRVYCRPSCGARLARREHVTFHDSAAQARAAGFRACKRCRPDDAPLARRQALIVTSACRLIAASDTAPDLQTLATHAGLSPQHFHRLFRRITGITPRAYAAHHRAERVREALARPGSITRAMNDAGYQSSGRFYEDAGPRLGMHPGRHRAQGEGVVIRFAIGECSLGSILVAATERGVCAIALGDDPETLLSDFQRRFARAQLVGGDRAFRVLMARVLSLVERPALDVDLPLDVRGTAFQERVWQALRAIPIGTTTSYAALARQLGVPRGHRAVARACASNELAVVIPCHRVVRVDGDLAGYRWGLERKRMLLAREAAATPTKRRTK